MKNVRDKEDILERLANLYEESGRAEDTEKIIKDIEKKRSRAKQSKKIKTSNISRDKLDGEIAFKSAGVFKDTKIKEKSPNKIKRKIGRNEPCPCGSGKKYKMCCGR
ncbi:hypothetical protein ES703_101605 [subsurface metagenome]